MEKLDMSKEEMAMTEAKLKSSINGPSSGKWIGMENYRKKPCPVDPELAKVTGRVKPPINPSRCLEGTVAMGKNKVLYQISGSKWVKLLLGDDAKKSVMTKLGEPGDVAMLDAMMDIDDLGRKIKKMKRRQCTVDPKLLADPKRKVPPIRPRECKEGTLAYGKKRGALRSSQWKMGNGVQTHVEAGSRTGERAVT